MSETPDPARPRPARRTRGCLIPVIFVALWLGGGLLRAEGVARGLFASAHGAGATVTDVQINGEIPLIPPFWGVSIRGTVHEAGGGSYPSSMLLCIEPITGLGIGCGSG